VRSLVAYVVLAACIFVSYQGYENARGGEETEDLARRHACDVEPTCVLKSERASQKSDMFRRRYEWQTTVGPVLVTCRREHMFLGAWSCKAEPGRL
jgi:hypothetical protein